MPRRAARTVHYSSLDTVRWRRQLCCEAELAVRRWHHCWWRAWRSEARLWTEKAVVQPRKTIEEKEAQVEERHQKSECQREAHEPPRTPARGCRWTCLVVEDQANQGKGKWLGDAVVQCRVHGAEELKAIWCKWLDADRDEDKIPSAAPRRQSASNPKQ